MTCCCSRCFATYGHRKNNETEHGWQFSDFSYSRPLLVPWSPVWAGFAMSLVVFGIWLHILTPVQTVTLLVGYGLLVQGYGIWKLRHALSWHRVMPFILGGAIGVPIGAVLLANINPSHMRTVVGLLLVLYSAYGLVRPVIKPVQAKTPADIGIGFLNGLLGGLTGLAGIVVVIWCQLRGWPKDHQRTVFQPVGFAVFVPQYR